MIKPQRTNEEIVEVMAQPADFRMPGHSVPVDHVFKELRPTKRSDAARLSLTIGGRGFDAPRKPWWRRWWR